MIFSNWLLMYLNNDEVFNLIEDSLHYLKEGGYFFFRESCFHASGTQYVHFVLKTTGQS